MYGQVYILSRAPVVRVLVKMCQDCNTTIFIFAVFVVSLSLTPSVKCSVFFYIFNNYVLSFFGLRFLDWMAFDTCDMHGAVLSDGSVSGDCGTDRSSHGAFCDRRSRFLCAAIWAWNSFRSRWRHQHPYRFSENILIQFYLLAPSRHSNTFLCFVLSPCFILQFYVFSIMCISL